MQRPTLTIDLVAIAENWRALDALSPARTAAVVKADAYGLGLERIVPALQKAGANAFFVANTAEAGAAREALGPEPEIYILSGAAGELEEAAKANAAPVLHTLEQIREALNFSKALRYGLQLDTGMNRLGLRAPDFIELAEMDLRKLDIRLAMSHLACADDPGHPKTDQQAAQFAQAAPQLKSLFPSAALSLLATGGLINAPHLAYDLTRPGVGLYGGAPFSKASPVVRLEAPILRVWSVEPGESAGYGAQWTARRPSVLATIAAGYADGFHRSLANKGRAIIGGAQAPFAGRVSMDLITLDVTDAPKPRPGDAAILLNEALTIDDLATSAGTIGYEILTSLGRRFIRRYNTDLNLS